MITATRNHQADGSPEAFTVYTPECDRCGYTLDAANTIPLAQTGIQDKGWQWVGLNELLCRSCHDRQQRINTRQTNLAPHNRGAYGRAA
jgi:hypothetical protein